MSSTTLDRSVEAERQTEQPSATSPRSEERRQRSLVRFAVHHLPTLLVLAALAGVGAYGHYSHWKLPKFSSLAGAAPAQLADWCEEHGVPESRCVECSTDVMPKGPDYGWCKEHGVHNCPLHHPDVAQVKTTPEVTERDLQRAARALAVRPRKINNSVCKLHQRRIQFASVEAVEQAGVDIALVARQPVVETVTGNGEITYDETRLANLSSRVPGTIWRVEKRIGDRVRAGEALAVVDAMAIGQAKAELVDALVNERLQRATVERLQRLSGQVVAASRVLEAEAAFEKAQVQVLAAQQTLANLGLSVDLAALRVLPSQEQFIAIRRLGMEDLDAGFVSTGPMTANLPTTANLLPIRAPTDGVVIDRKVVAGEVVDAEDVLFQIADTSQMWLNLNVPMEEAGRLALGQPVRFRPDADQPEVAGTLSWISTAADKQTRMVKIRADLPNPDGRLRNETFGAGEVVLREEPDAIVVPNEAVHWEGCCQIVFVRDKGYFESPESPKVFHVRTVRVGVKNDQFAEVIAGVLPGEVVAAKGSDVLQAQLLKNNLGEGCACVAE